MMRHWHSSPALWLAAVLAVLILGTAPLRAATSAEERAFNAAVAEFNDEFWLRSEADFADFTKKYPESAHYAEAILYEAQALFKRNQYSAAIELLSSQEAHAGSLEGRFVYWKAEARFANRNYGEAADTYAGLVRDFPAADADLRLAAVVGESEARAKLQDWRRVIGALKPADGEFQKLSQSNPTNKLVVSGLLLLGEAELAQQDCAAAEGVLRNLAQRKLGEEAEWRRRYLLCRAQLAAGKVDEALAGSTNLLDLAVESRSASQQAASVALQAEILEWIDRLPEAVKALEQYLDKDLPRDFRRPAMLRVVELDLRQNLTESAAKKLQDYLARYPDEKASDLALLTQGELWLKLHYQTAQSGSKNGNGQPDAGTNYLEQAASSFGKLITTFTNSPFLGKAQLNLGWCLLAQVKIPESQAAFSNAVNNLPLSEDQAVARFKLADLQFQQKDFGGALTNYGLIIDRYAAIPAVTNGLFEPALYQMIQAGIEQTNLAVADEAMGRLMAWFPSGPLLEPGALLLAQELNRQGYAAHARGVLSTFAARLPNSPLLPQVKLAIARTYETESNWVEALNQYTNWLATYTNNPLQPQAEFACAWANAAAQFETNAAVLFTNFLAKFPNHKLAPWAQYWLADHCWRQEDFQGAELAYQEVYKRWHTSNEGTLYDLANRARMMAGRAAVARESSDAVDYFAQLTSTNLPAQLEQEALFAYGDARMKLPSRDTNDLGANFKVAIKLFGVITNKYASNSIAALATGRIGDCYFQLAGLDPAHYQYSSITNACLAYQMVTDSPLADVAARSQAEVGIVLCLEEMARLQTGAEQKASLERALNHSLNVVYGQNLRQGETQDLFWVQKAGMEAGRLAEGLGEIQQAVKLYERLGDLLPPMRDTFEKKKLNLMGKLDVGSNNRP